MIAGRSASAPERYATWESVTSATSPPAQAARTSAACGPLDRVALEHAHLGGARAREALEHVAIGREVVAIGDDHASRGPGVEGRVHELVEVDGGRVAGQHLAGPRAEHRLGEQVAGAHRRVDPLVPAPHELALPLPHDRVDPCGGRERHAAEGVAVEVDARRVVECEALAEGGERVGPVEGLGTLPPVGHRESVRQRPALPVSYPTRVMSSSS